MLAIKFIHMKDYFCKRFNMDDVGLGGCIKSENNIINIIKNRGLC